MDKITVRLAENSEGEKVRKLLEAQHGAQESSLKWDAISPYWLVAEADGEIVGCIQTRPSRPMGSLESLSTARHLTEVERGKVVRELAMAGMAVLHGHGTQQVQMFISFELRAFKRVLKKRGAVVLGQGNLLVKRIA